MIFAEIVLISDSDEEEENTSQQSVPAPASEGSQEGKPRRRLSNELIDLSTFSKETIASR